MELQQVHKAIRKADQDFGMIKKGDKVAVAMSGGKDSLLLALALKMYQKFDHTDFDLVAIHVDVGFDENEPEKMIEFCRKYDIPLEIVQTHIFDILKEPKHTRNGKIQCSLCSTLKKGALFKRAKELGCNSVAFGHHGQDDAETLLMNIIYQGKFEKMNPKFHLDDVDLDEIRPLIYMDEKDVIKAVRQNEITPVKKICPNDGFTKREEMKQLLTSFYRMYPQARNNVLKALKEESLKNQKKAGN